MKKIALCVLVGIVIASSQLRAQNRMTAHAGLNYSSVTSKNSINPDGIFGLNAGVAAKIYWDELGWSVMPEVNFSQEGYKNQRLDYINIPVSVGFDFTPTFSLSAGIQYSFLVGGANDARTFISNDNYAFLVTFEFFPTDRFVTGLRFSNGLKNIIDRPDLIIVQAANTYSVQFYVGINLFKKH